MNYNVLSYKSKGDIYNTLVTDFNNGIKKYIKVKQADLLQEIGRELGFPIYSLSFKGETFINRQAGVKGRKLYLPVLPEEIQARLDDFLEFIDDTYKKMASCNSFIYRVVNKQANTFGDLQELLPASMTRVIEQNYSIPDNVKYVSDPEEIEKLQVRNGPKLALLTELQLLNSLVS